MTIQRYTVVVAHATGVNSSVLVMSGDYFGTDEQKALIEAFLAEEKGWKNPMLLACVPDEVSHGTTKKD